MPSSAERAKLKVAGEKRGKSLTASLTASKQAERFRGSLCSAGVVSESELDSFVREKGLEVEEDPDKEWLPVNCKKGFAEVDSIAGDVKGIVVSFEDESSPLWSSKLEKSVSELAPIIEDLKGTIASFEDKSVNAIDEAMRKSTVTNEATSEYPPILGDLKSTIGSFEDRSVGATDQGMQKSTVATEATTTMDGTDSKEPSIAQQRTEIAFEPEKERPISIAIPSEVEGFSVRSTSQIESSDHLDASASVALEPGKVNPGCKGAPFQEDVFAKTDGLLRNEAAFGCEPCEAGFQSNQKSVACAVADDDMTVVVVEESTTIVDVGADEDVDRPNSLVDLGAVERNETKQGPGARKMEKRKSKKGVVKSKQRPFVCEAETHEAKPASISNCPEEVDPARSELVASSLAVTSTVAPSEPQAPLVFNENKQETKKCCVVS